MRKEFLSRCVIAGLTILLAVPGCTPQDVATTRGLAATDTTTTTGNGGTTISKAEAPPVVEIRHLVEPAISTADYPNYYTGTGLAGAGTYVRKLTLPQNYAGLLYLGGLNISSLANRFITVRFTFGVSGTQVRIPAVVSKAPGITPNAAIDVLVMDLRSKPFQDLRLLYDLYDYRDYSDSDNSPVETNRDPDLYCRGLALSDDSTFDGQGRCDGLAADGTTAISEQCLYAYAKVLDRGLGKVTGATTYTENYPVVAQTDYTSNFLGYYAQTPDNLLNRCLPDKSLGTSVTVVTGQSANTRVADLSFSVFNTNGVLTQTNASGITIYSQTVRFLGPFKPINTANWEISGDAAFGSTGLFDYVPLYPAKPTFAEKMDAMYHYRSKMFPRFAKLGLNNKVSYLETTDYTNPDTKNVMTMAAGGTSGYVDGCSTRVLSVNARGDHIGSCNVTGKIEILAVDNSNTEFVVASTNQVVLQLVRATQITGTNTEYLYSNFKTCQNNNQCGSAECCYNKRCWSNELVAQCVEDTSASVLTVGQSCANDYQCASLCCNRSTGKCAAHDTSVTPPVLCGKPLGQSCISEEWCAQQFVNYCYIIDDGINPTTGKQACHKQCFPRKAYGQCRNNTCVAPATPSEPSFDTTKDPPDCTGAIPAPDFSGT